MSDEIELDVGEPTPTEPVVSETTTEAPKKKEVANAVLRDSFTMPADTKTGMNYTLLFRPILVIFSRR